MGQGRKEEEGERRKEKGKEIVESVHLLGVLF